MIVTYVLFNYLSELIAHIVLDITIGVSVLLICRAFFTMRFHSSSSSFASSKSMSSGSADKRWPAGKLKATGTRAVPGIPKPWERWKPIPLRQRCEWLWRCGICNKEVRCNRHWLWRCDTCNMKYCRRHAAGRQPSGGHQCQRCCEQINACMKRPAGAE